MKKYIIGFIILTVNSCNLFDKDERLLAEHLKSNGKKINIYYVGLGATTNDVIQVRKSNQDSIIWASDRYNYLKDSKLINDTILKMVLSDTGFNTTKNNKADTLTIKIQ